MRGELSKKGGASGSFLRKSPARLGELGGKGFLTPMLCISTVLGEKTCFREENPSRGASVMLLTHFREQFREDFPSFIIRSSCVLHSSTGKFSNLRLSIHFLFCWPAFSFRSLSVFFSSVFNEL